MNTPCVRVLLCDGWEKMRFEVHEKRKPVGTITPSIVIQSGFCDLRRESRNRSENPACIYPLGEIYKPHFPKA